MRFEKQFCIIFFIYASISFGQTAEDFTATDFSGKTHHLYEYLDAGKYVIIDIGFPKCSDCPFAVAPVNSVYYKYEQNKGNVIVLHINKANTDSQVIANYINEYGLKYPVINNGESIVSKFSPGSFSQVIVIKPDRSYIKWAGPDVQIAIQMANVPDPDSELKLSTPSTDLQTNGTWVAKIDNLGSTLDTTGGLIQNGVVKVKFNMVEKADASTILEANYTSPPEKKPVLRIEYKSNTPLYVTLGLDKYDNYFYSEHSFDLAASEDWKIKIIRMDSLDIYQSELPENMVPFDISKLSWIWFQPANPKEQHIEIREFKLYNLSNSSIKYSLSNADKGINCLHVFNNNISFIAEKHGYYSISILNVNGSCVQKIANQFFVPGKHAIHYNSNKLSNGTYVVELNTNQGYIAKRMVKAR